jgi:hypothetical protein
MVSEFILAIIIGFVGFALVVIDDKLHGSKEQTSHSDPVDALRLSLK